MLKKWFGKITQNGDKKPSGVFNISSQKVVKKEDQEIKSTLLKEGVDKRMGVLEERIAYYKIIRDYLMDSQPCLALDKIDGHFAIYDKKTEKALVIFGDPLGIASESVYGDAYKANGTDDFKQLQFSCKVTKTFEIEATIMKVLTNIVSSQSFPNFPMMFADLHCDTNLEVKGKSDKYSILISEFAETGDLETWLNLKEWKIAGYLNANAEAIIFSIVAQIFLFVYKFHELGYIHCDLHVGNVLVHKVESGGYWLYHVSYKNDNGEIISKEVCVENHGYFLVMWDFGKCKEMKTYKKDDADDAGDMAGTSLMQRCTNDYGIASDITLKDESGNETEFLFQYKRKPWFTLFKASLRKILYKNTLECTLQDEENTIIQNFVELYTKRTTQRDARAINQETPYKIGINPLLF